MQSFLEKYQTTVIKLVTIIGILLALFLLTATLGNMKEYRYIGSGMEAKNTITVSGEGKIERAPDTAKVTFTVRNEQKDVKVAQDNVSAKIDAIEKELINAGIDEKYIRTDSYNSYPQYNYPQVSCSSLGCPPQGNPTIRGYEVSHSITVSIKNLDSIETVLGILADNDVTDMQGPNFGFEDDKAIAREARDLAIADARGEAEKLAKSLGVDIVRIVSFNESGNAMPLMYARADASGAGSIKAPSIPVGNQSLQSNVTIVYEIR